VSCKKNGDGIGPSISLIAPTEGLTISLPDTLQVIAEISDNISVKSVRLSIVDQENISAGPVAVFTYSQPQVALNVEFIIDDLDMETGAYQLQVAASDGENETKTYVPLNLIEVPRVVTGGMYSSGIGAQTSFQYEMITGEGGVISAMGSSGVFAYSSRLSRAFFSQENDRVLVAYAYGSDWNFIWERELMNLSEGLSIEQIQYDPSRKEVIVNTGPGDIYIYSWNGTFNGNIDVNVNEICQDIQVDADELWLALKKSNGQNSVVQVFRDSGSRGTELPLNFTPVLIESYSENRLVLAMDNGDIKIINTQTAAETPVDIPGDAEALEMKVYNGEVFIMKAEQLFRVTSNYQVQSIYSGLNMRSLEIDEVNGRVFIVDGADLKVFNLFPWTLLNTESLQPEVMHYSILYNK